MLCERCKKNEATFHKSVSINGKGYETHLCAECANEVDFNNSEFELFDMQFEQLSKKMLSNFWDDDSFFMPTQMLEKNTKKCENCGSSFNDFLRRGRLGCANCYDTFNEEIRDMLENMDNPTDFSLEVGSELKETKPTELEQLEQQFNKAIAEERYEDAGELKKKINELKGDK